MAAPKAHIKVSGSWKEVLKMHVRVSGTWKRVNKAYVRVSGVWKQFLQSAVASSFSGVFTASGSTDTITSATRTYTLGAGNTGRVTFSGVINGGSGVMEYNLNGAGFPGNSITEGLTITLSNTQTLAARSTSMASGNVSFFTLTDTDTGTVLENASLTRT